ncbi:MAG: hypothetical protein CM1200mP39_17200 [Dehalococcoidia bacterium]|nr:MAG: hypothetical protein CM1200mP39_17200 [Dehalococcoidia bacterium]
MRAGNITQSDYDRWNLRSIVPRTLHGYGSRFDNGSIVETLGMSLPGGAAVPGADSGGKSLRRVWAYGC